MRVSSLLPFVAVVAADLACRGGQNHTSERNGCLTYEDTTTILANYISVFSGISTNDGGELANTTFAEDYTLYSQSLWWIYNGNNSFISIQYPDQPYPPFDVPGDYPPVAANRAQLIAQNSGGFDSGNPFKVLGVMYNCDGFAFYWAGAFNSNATFGSVNGIDVVFVQPNGYLVEKTFSEYNTIDFDYGNGFHLDPN